jgi:asparagine synthase (glutamine-hydrolysing)
MCGITGILDFKGNPRTLDAITTMTRTLEHRGPDGENIWIDPDAGVALGHRRLAIIDLSEMGRQPMFSANNRYVLTFNGEIYNAAELASQLKSMGTVFRGHSDTEVIVESFATWGIEDSLKRLNGMFALGVWDRAERTLTLARDRFGIKPLYWSQFGQLILFGSELKALCSHPSFVGELDRDSISSFMRHGYIAAPYSVYRNVWKLEPGHSLTVGKTGRPQISCYFSMRELAACRKSSFTDQDATAELDKLLKDAVRRCMVSDVPLGAFLSGGIDSSTVAALMQDISPNPIRTFTIGFTDERFNEAKQAKAIARHLGTDHTELYVQNSDVLAVIPKLNYYFDEPFADPSQIPTYLLAKLARRDVTVALSGDGGDELFGGYSRYIHMQQLWPALDRIPARLQSALSRLLGIILAPHRKVDQLLPTRGSDKLQKLFGFFQDGSRLALYRQLQSAWPSPDKLVLGANEPMGPHSEAEISAQLLNGIDELRLVDFLTYLPEHVLTKVDRATMSSGLEARVPLLDNILLQFAWSLPPEMLVRNQSGKWLLREVLAKYVPREMFERPKQGFMPPISDWLRGPLRDWAEALIDPQKLREQGILQPDLVLARWQNHLKPNAHKDPWCSPIWNVLTFQAWLESQTSSHKRQVKLCSGQEHSQRLATSSSVL